MTEIMGPMEGRFSGISTVGLSGAYASLTFSLLIVVLNIHVAYLSCSWYTHMNNLEVAAMLM